jgi:hypothetical protein
MAQIAAVGLNDGNIHLFKLSWLGTTVTDSSGTHYPYNVVHMWTEPDPYHWNLGGWTFLVHTGL